MGEPDRMSLTTDFSAELIRAANEAGRLSPFEVKRLLNRSVATIRDMLDETDRHAWQQSRKGRRDRSTGGCGES